MNLKNSDMEEKLKEAYQQAGKEMPAKKKKVSVVKRPTGGQRSNRKKNSSKHRQAVRSVRDERGSQKVSIDAQGPKSRKRKKKSGKKRTRNPVVATPPLLGPSYSAKPKSTRQLPETTVLTPRESMHFEPNLNFFNRRGDDRRTIIDEPCLTKISPSGDDEVQLVIGLDLGTSMTKVIIGDPDQKRFYAVPFSPGSENPYLISTKILINERNIIIIDTADSPDLLSDIKLELMKAESDEAIIHLAGYIAQIVRYSIRWFLSEHADDYRGIKFFWTMAMGLPVDSARQSELENRFRIASISGAQAAISQSTIDVFTLYELIGQVKNDLEQIGVDLRNGEESNVQSRFEELGGDEGVVVVVPEIAAQVVGLFRSRRWEDKKPFSFLMDVGAGTVDSAVFSLVDAKQQGKELAFCAFSCDVNEMGVINLHQDRVDWLQRNLPQGLLGREKVITYLENIKRFKGAIPEKIEDYINHVELIRGKSNLDPDKRYKDQLWDKVYMGVLREAKEKNKRDRAWSGLRTIICGGGARSEYYKSYIGGISKNSGFDLQIELLEKPKNLFAPGLHEEEYNRLSVAYGLAQGTQWEYRWPDSFEEIIYTEKENTASLVSKDMV